MIKLITFFLSSISNKDILNLYSENTLNNVKFIKEHNSNKDNTYTLGVNEHIYNVYKDEFTISTMSIYNNNKSKEVSLENIKYVPNSIDWEEKNKVSSVKNQGQCGSCWAFSATEAVESAWAIKKNQLYNLSEQELVDCSSSYGNHGCEGGLMDNAFEYII